MRWRLKLSHYSYDICYRPGAQNGPADTLSRAYSAYITTVSELEYMHSALCHPGITED